LFPALDIVISDEALKMNSRLNFSYLSLPHGQIILILFRFLVKFDLGLLYEDLLLYQCFREASQDIFVGTNCIEMFLYFCRRKSFGLEKYSYLLQASNTRKMFENIRRQHCSLLAKGYFLLYRLDLFKGQPEIEILHEFLSRIDWSGSLEIFNLFLLGVFDEIVEEVLVKIFGV
jgi:hypothetical protein